MIYFLIAKVVFVILYLMFVASTFINKYKTELAEGIFADTIYGSLLEIELKDISTSLYEEGLFSTIGLGFLVALAYIVMTLLLAIPIALVSLLWVVMIPVIIMILLIKRKKNNETE